MYAHGFDPATSDRYRRLLAKAGADRGETPPAMSQVEPISDVSEGWRVTATIGGQRIETVFEVLRYEDVVRHWRNRGLATRLWTGFGSWLRFVFGGGLKRTYELAKGPAGLFFYPVAMILFFVLTGLLIGRLFGEGVEWMGGPDWASQVGRVIGVTGGLYFSIRFERALFAHLMLALFDFLVRMAEDKSPAGRMESRIKLFGERIVECVRDADETKVDEILIVGHSLGGLIATKALARAMEADVDLTGGRAAVSLLTLGSVAGYVSCHGGPGADQYGRDLVRIARDDDLAWVDVSSPRDWFSFGLVDPLLMATDPPREAQSPLVISAKFGKFEPDPDDRRTKFRAMGLHMKYLAAPDKAGAFDFFAVAAGPQTLADRFRNRRNSPKARMLDQ